MVALVGVYGAELVETALTVDIRVPFNERASNLDATPVVYRPAAWRAGMTNWLSWKLVLQRTNWDACSTRRRQYYLAGLGGGRGSGAREK